MAGGVDWFQERRSEGLGTVLSLMVVAAGLAGLLWLGWHLWSRPGSSFDGRNVSEVMLLDADGNSHRVGDLNGKVVRSWSGYTPGRLERELQAVLRP